MAYAQDTINNVNAPAVLQAVWEGLLIDAGWTIVETLNPSSTFHTTVYKSDGGDNVCGYDWYLSIQWNAIGTEQQMEVRSGTRYDTGTHTLSGIPGAMRATGSSFGPVSGFADENGDLFASFNVNVATNTTQTVSSHGTAGIPKSWFATVIPSSAFGYWLSVTLDHVSIYTTIAVTGNEARSWITGSLAMEPDWLSLPFGVVEGALVNFGGAAGISGSLLGRSSPTEPISPSNDYTNFVGVQLPTLDGAWLPAYAWKPNFYLTGATGINGTPPYDNPGYGDGFLIGQPVDWYCVYGGSLGDTVEIEGATYVLSGLINGYTGFGGHGAYVAVLVEA